jgi:Zn-dependent protease with chaperone function
MDPRHPLESTPTPDLAARERAQARHQSLAMGLLALPNLFLRSFLTLTFLYGLLGLVLVALVEFGLLNATLGLIIGVVVALVQFAIGPFIMDLTLRWLYTMRWVQPEDLPDHLHSFVQRVCDEYRMKFPSFGIIDDGAPQAFTYGHHPSNARVVISRGLFTLLEPEEVEAVVAHELGHARNWDMALMTLANLVPLLLYFLYRAAINLGSGGDNDSKGRLPALVVAAGAFVLYIVSQYIVLWFSRTREYYADRFAGRVTNNPNALARALIKIAYGLAAQDSQESEKEAAGKKTKKKEVAGTGALAALNIFDRTAAVSMVMCSASQKTGTGNSVADTRHLDVERVKGAMQWDLWSPWAIYYELHSTHPLVAKRLRYLGDQASSQGQTPFVVFDRSQPRSYWGDFLVDLLMMALPTLGLLIGLFGFGVHSLLAGAALWWWLGVAVALLGAGGVLKTRFRYRRGMFPHLTVAALLGHVNVSGVRPVQVTLTGQIIGKGVPGLIWSEDFVLQDPTGILFLDYRQPLAIWSWLFGLLRAGQYQGKEVCVRGWFRRAPVPYLELDHLEVMDGSLPNRGCYTSYVTFGWYAFLLLGGLAGAVVVGLLV